jgi:NDP-sugar pyrophosphorylase family protein
MTDNVPKPILPIGGRPFLDYQLWFLGKYGVTTVVMCVGYLSEVVKARYGTAAPFGLRVVFSHESSPLGTGGALVLARPHLDDMFFVFNGDTVLDVDLGALAALLMGAPQALAAVALRQVPNAGRYGRVSLDFGWISGFAEKSTNEPGLINGGVYCLRRSALDLLPSSACSLEKDLFPRLARERRLLGMPCDGYFIDIGLPETLASAEKELPAWMLARDARFAKSGLVNTK